MQINRHPSLEYSWRLYHDLLLNDNDDDDDDVSDGDDDVEKEEDDVEIIFKKT